MLSRVARPKNVVRLRLLSGRRALCPSLATLRSHSHASRPTSLANSPTTVTHERRRRPSFQSNRNLATAADQSAIEQSPYSPFENSSYPVGRSYEQLSSLFPPLAQDFDPSSLIIVDDALQTKPRVLRKVKGIGGDEDEMMANLDVSLKVGRFDRAASLVTRLGEYYPVGSPEYLALHNRYLEAMVSHMIVTRQHNMVLPLQRWFEVDMPAGGVQADATTFAIMIRMALRMFHGGKRDRSVRRYWEFAKKASVEEEVLAVPVLSELELGELSEVRFHLVLRL